MTSGVFGTFAGRHTLHMCHAQAGIACYFHGHSCIYGRFIDPDSQMKVPWRIFGTACLLKTSGLVSQAHQWVSRRSASPAKYFPGAAHLPAHTSFRCFLSMLISPYRSFNCLRTAGLQSTVKGLQACIFQSAIFQLAMQFKRGWDQRHG